MRKTMHDYAPFFVAGLVAAATLWLAVLASGTR